MRILRMKIIRFNEYSQKKKIKCISYRAKGTPAAEGALCAALLRRPIFSVCRWPNSHKFCPMAAVVTSPTSLSVRKVLSTESVSAETFTISEAAATVLLLFVVQLLRLLLLIRLKMLVPLVSGLVLFVMGWMSGLFILVPVLLMLNLLLFN